MFEYQQYQPSAQLADYIECYWILRAEACFLNSPDPLVPGGRIEMIFNFASPVNWLIAKDNPGGISFPGPIFMGQRNKVFYVAATGKVDMLGLRFKPGGLAAFTNMPVSGLSNAMVPAAFILGTQVNDWEALLYEQQDTMAMLRMLDTLMIKALKAVPRDNLLMNIAIAALRSGNEDTSIATVCHQTGYNYKKLERVFIRNTGYTPKYYHKILRFNKAIRLMDTADALTSICYACNYFDQAHFIRDFRQFTGTTPGQFKRGDNKIADILIKHQSV
ncbi:helix-turn-helix domain-containing protein [Chitinophaga ginsengisoli]|uniref:AraC family transcriptional regulator n=1 Tax=Chitinophaga ginsengisoli TaxID=363837 RepID=A0A2P8G547_9BACT|nr:helix-turn-helix domain-containing protein [Chitinophaga ginsengisoli]PSL29015.1 AraC family transcriptional regulator [Chitinophaga ginsengisoli]